MMTCNSITQHKIPAQMKVQINNFAVSSLYDYIVVGLNYDASAEIQNCFYYKLSLLLLLLGIYDIAEKV